MTHTSHPVPQNGSPLRIRVADAADFPRLIPLVNAAYSIESFLEGTRTDEDRMADLMRKGSILIAEDGSGRPLACVYTEVRGERGYLGQLAVDPAHQSRGLARRIVAAAEQHLRRQGCVAVDIIVLNLRPELPPIYRRFGYVENGTVPFKPTRPLKPGFECHGIVMSKML